MGRGRGRLKPGWTRVAFGDVVRQVKEHVDPATAGLERYVAGEHMDTDDLRLRRWGTVGNGYLGPAFHARFRPGQVLYGSRRTYLRKVSVADFEGVTANTTFVLETKDPNLLLPALLPFVMQTEAFHTSTQSRNPRARSIRTSTSRTSPPTSSRFHRRTNNTGLPPHFENVTALRRLSVHLSKLYE